MNVKPGDRAWITRSKVCSNIGKLVLVGEYVPPGTLMEIDGVAFQGRAPAFVVESLMGPLVTSPAKKVVLRKVHTAAWLKPQRDPGDDAKDETLEWLPVPLKHKEPA